MVSVDDTYWAVENLNTELFERGDDVHEDYALIFKSDGWTITVTFLGKVIYRDDDDCRPTDADSGLYTIGMKAHLKELCNNEIERLQTMGF